MSVIQHKINVLSFVQTKSDLKESPGAFLQGGIKQDIYFSAASRLHTDYFVSITKVRSGTSVLL